jgi:formate dehydrogenase alpha subunit
VGALVEKRRLGKGREWEMKKVKTVCSYCGVGCNMELHVKDNEIVKVSADRNSPVNNGRLCVKGRFGFDYVHHPERLTHPLMRENGSLVQTNWNTAFKLVVSRLTEIREKYGPDSIAFLSSAKCTNEENYLMQKFARVVIGTNNIDHCARL